MTSAIYVNDINAMKREIKDTYYAWARQLYEEAVNDVDKNKIDLAIEKCRKAQEMYPPCKNLMDAEIAKFQNRKRAIEFKEETTLKKADEEFEDMRNETELQLQRGRAFYKIGRLSDARQKFEDVIAKEPYNAVAIDYLRRIYLKMIKYGQQRKKLFHEEALDEASWKSVAPVLVAGSVEGSEETVSAPVEKVDAAKNLTQKLKNIKLPKLHFEDTPLDEVVKYLKRRSSELDEDKEGVNFVLLFNSEGGAEGESADKSSKAESEDEDGEKSEESSEQEGEDGEEGGGASAGANGMPLITMYFGADESEGGEGEDGEKKEKKPTQEISLYTAIDKICKGHDLKYRIDEHAVVIAGKDVPLDDLVTESYPIDKDALDALVGDSSDAAAIAEAFETNYGIKFDAAAGSQAVYDEHTHSLLVTHVPDVQAIVEKDIIRQLNTRNPQIQLQVKFVEVSMNDLEELGFEYTVSRPLGYRVEDLPMMPLTAGKIYNTNSASNGGTSFALYSVDNNGVVSHVTEISGRDMILTQPVTTYESGSLINANLQSFNKAFDLEGNVKNGDIVSNQRLKPISYNNGAYVSKGDAFTVTEDGWYAALVPEGADKTHTFGANDRLTRNVQDDPLAFGLEENSLRQDTIFNWTHSNAEGYTFNAKIHALDQADSTDLLSSPRVTTLNGQSATIKMVTEKYYPESWGESEINDVNGMKMFVPSIPEFGEPKEEGVVLEVEPNIDDENTLINLTVNPVILEFVGWTDYSYDVILEGETYQNILRMPILSARAVSTTVSCYDKATLVLGGVIKDKVTEVNDQYPILGDIPILGRLFQSKGKNMEKTNLLIFLTATLVNPDGSLYRPEGSSERGVPKL